MASNGDGGSLIAPSGSAVEQLVKLEDFYHDEHLTCAPNSLLILRCSMMPPSVVDRTEEDFYRQAVRNFRASMPFFRRLHLKGGYIYKPLQQTAALLDAEFGIAVANLSAITASFAKEYIQVHTVQYKIVLAFEFEIFLVSNPLVMVELFGRCPTLQEMKDRKFSMKMRLNGVDCSLTTIIDDNQEFLKLSAGRHAIE